MDGSASELAHPDSAIGDKPDQHRALRNRHGQRRHGPTPRQSNGSLLG
jgi:hypothetical protein